MDYRRSRTLASVLSWLLAALLFTWLTLYISAGFGVQGRSLIAATLFLAVFQGRRAVFLRADKILYRNILQTGYSKLMASFTERVRTCFTMPEFITAIREGLEKTLDASVMLIKSNTWEVVYASPATLTSDPGMLPALKKNFRELSDGIGFLDERYSLSGDRKSVV